MKSSTFIGFIISIHVLFILLEIVKQNQLAQLSYTNQRLLNRLQELQKQEQQLIQQLEQEHNFDKVQEFAQTNLQFKPQTLKQTKVAPYAHS